MPSWTELFQSADRYGVGLVVTITLCAFGAWAGVYFTRRTFGDSGWLSKLVERLTGEQGYVSRLVDAHTNFVDTVKDTTKRQTNAQEIQASALALVSEQTEHQTQMLRELKSSHDRIEKCVGLGCDLIEHFAKSTERMTPEVTDSIHRIRAEFATRRYRRHHVDDDQDGED